MLGMRLGGIDPSILRELSGVYKPFTKAFKELISNAFDADSEHVRVKFANDFSAVTVVDDGNGMTPFEFRNDFTRIGGGARRWSGEKTLGGRLRIGSKGIGFLALARYCGCLEVESAANRSFELTVEIPSTPASVDITKLLGIPLDRTLLARNLSYEIRLAKSPTKQILEGRHYKWNPKTSKVSIDGNFGPAVFRVTIDCRQLVFKAVLDFDRLLLLADNADLEKLDDFAAIDVRERNGRDVPPGTRITALALKNFVRRELRIEQRKGFVRNVGSRPGLERFIWSLSRCTPLAYEVASGHKNENLARFLPVPSRSTLALEVTHAGKSFNLHRPIFPFEPDSPLVEPDMLVRVEIDEAGLNAEGFLVGYESIIFPAEYRGISIRVRGVAIGDGAFMGAESLLTGANRAALSQITGEINILSGLDAADTLNPGRESFYEESEHYRILQRYLRGDGENVSGYLGRIISAVLRRSGVRSALKSVLGRAETYRRTLDDISAAVTHIVASGDQTGAAFKKLLRSTHSKVNGLADARPFDLGVPVRVGGLAVVPIHNSTEAAVVDYCSEQIKINISRPEWDWSVLLFDRVFNVTHKRGLPNHPIGELDMKKELILINWSHPVKLQMDDRGFLRTALAWVLAKEAAKNDPTLMMDAALRLLSFTNSNG